MSETSALEGIVAVGHKCIVIAGLYKQHISIDNSRLLKFYYGAGAHVDFLNDGGRYNGVTHLPYNNRNVVGVDVIVGVDHKFEKLLLNVGFDFKPFVDFYNGSNFYLTED
jgi:hypothetical protein